MLIDVDIMHGVQNPTGNNPHAGGMSYDEATKILEESYQREQEHKQRLEEKRRRRGDVMEGERLTRAEMDARMLAFLYVVLLHPFLLLFLSNQGIISEHTSLRIPIPKTRKTRRTRTRKTAVLRGGMKTIRTTVSRARTSSNRTTRTYLASSALTKRGFRGPYPGKSRVTQLCILFRDVTINL